jgi:hypothetical protein
MGDRARPGELQREAARVDEYVLAQKIEERAKAGKIVQLTPETALRVARALQNNVALRSGKVGAYTVNSWNPNGTLKRAFGSLDQQDAALGAFEGVVREFPNDHITCRDGARIIREHNRPKDRR